MSGRRPIWPNPSPRKVGGALRTKISPVLPKTEFFNSIAPFWQAGAGAAKVWFEPVVTDAEIFPKVGYD